VSVRRRLRLPLLALLSLHATGVVAQARDALYLDASPDADRNTVAIAMVVSPPRTAVRYDCGLDTIVRMAPGASPQKIGDHASIAMRPGQYSISAQYTYAGREGFMFEQHTFEPGHVYRIGCGGGTVRHAHIAISDVTEGGGTPAAPLPSPDAPAARDEPH